MLDKIGKWLDNLILNIARHGRVECHDCGEFKPKGERCRCWGR